MVLYILRRVALVCALAYQFHTLVWLGCDLRKHWPMFPSLGIEPRPCAKEAGNHWVIMAHCLINSPDANTDEYLESPVFPHGLFWFVDPGDHVTVR